MSKAEERANERYNITRGDDTEETSGIDMQRASNFIDGYHQAEEDLELTWEDMMAIDDFLDELLPPRRDSDELVLKGYYQEVLKRFKDFKERKEK